MEELFRMVKSTLDDTGYLSKVAAGVILTGGGSQCDGTIQLAEAVLNQPVRLGSPIEISGLSENVSTPIYSTAVGLAKFSIGDNEEYRPNSSGSNDKGITGSFTNLFKDFFKI